jgi:hypothetical protein
LIEVGGVAPSNWRFDSRDWWLGGARPHHGEADVPARAGRYLVTGDREVTSVLTVYRRTKTAINVGSSLTGQLSMT